MPVEVHLAGEHADVGSLERMVSGALVEVGQRLWTTLVAQLEAALPMPTACPACGGRMKANGRAPRRLVTLAGEIELRRRRYPCTACRAEQCRSIRRSDLNRAHSTPSESRSAGCG